MKIFDLHLGNKRLILSVLLFLVFGSFVSYGQTITSSSPKACEGDPLQLDVVGMTTPPSGNYQWFINGKKYKVTKLPHCSVFSAEFVGDNMKVGVAPYPSNEPQTTLDIPASTDCKSTVCRQSATGEYIFGTDFDPKESASSCRPVTEACLVHQFPDGVKLIANNNAYLGDNDQFLSVFHELPDTLKDGKENSYLFINDGQKFKIDFNKCDYFKDGPFRLFIRVYARFRNSNGCQPEFRSIKLDGMYGDQAKEQYLSASIYEDKTDERVFVKNFSSNSQPMFDAERKNVGVHSGEKFETNVLYRLDVEIGGYFTRFSQGANATIDFQIQSNNCLDIAVDFISFESENVCVTPRVACVGDMVSVATAGFASGRQITWEMYDPVTETWGSIPGVEYDAHEQFNPATSQMVSVNDRASIPMRKVGATLYRVSSVYGTDSQTGKPLVTQVEFTLIGEDCANNACAEIAGEVKNCVNENEDSFVHYKLNNTDIFDWMVGEKSYVWKLYDPNGTDITSSQLFNSAENGAPGTAEREVAVRFPRNAIAFSEDISNRPYKLKATVKNGNSEVCVDEFNFYVYRNPASRSLTLTSSEASPLCAADIDKGINLTVNNYKKDWGYTFDWYSATANTTEPWKALLDVDKAAACNGTNTGYSVIVSVDNHGCSDDLLLDFTVTPPTNPTITCPVTSDVELELGPDKTPREYKLPVIDASAITYACGPLPEVTVTVNGTPKAPGATLSLGEGTYTVQYTVTDGCGHHSSCSYQVKVTQGVPPTVDCSKIDPVVESVDGCDKSILVLQPEVSKITSEKKVTVSFYGYLKATSNPGVDPNSYVKGSQPSNFPVGDTYLLWAFADSMGNTAYCNQLVRVNDDRDLVVNCKTSADKIDTINVCTDTKWEDVSALYAERIPTSSYMECGDLPMPNVVTPSVSYKLSSESDSEYKTLTDDVVLKYNTRYTIRWTFVKSGANIITKTEYCYASIVLKDNEAPEVNCEKYPNVTVMVDYSTTDKNVTKDYATAAGVKDSTITSGFGMWATSIRHTFENTLKGKIPFPKKEDYTDNCDNDIEPYVELYDKNHNYITTFNEPKTLDEYKFKIDPATGQGTYYLVRKFVDKDGNEASCEQEVVVVDNFKPVPSDCPKEATLIASTPDDCDATYILESVPTARMDYWKYVKDVNYTMGMWGQPSGYFPPSTYEGWGGYNSLTGDVKQQTINIYPYKVSKIVDGKASSTITNGSTPEIVKAHLWKGVPGGPGTPGTPPAPGETWWDNDQNPDNGYTVYTEDFTAADKVSINSMFSHLGIGTHTFRWYYRNNIGNVDSCDFVITVEDKSAPTFKCPVSPAEVLTAVNATDCNATFNIKDFRPTEVKDCSPLGELIYSYEITQGVKSIVSKKTYENGSDENVTLPIGNYRFTWYIKDNANNEENCSFELFVKDNTLPTFDCPASTAITSVEDCSATYRVSKDAFNVADNCGEAWVYGYAIIDGDETTTVEVGLGATEIVIPNLSVGDHTIRWIISDVAGNKNSCEQTITVNDSSSFKVDCAPLDNVTVLTCKESLPWSTVKSELDKQGVLPASYTYFDCYEGKEANALEAIQYSLSGKNTYTTLAAGSPFQKQTAYDVRWIYTKSGSFIITQRDTCELTVYVGDTIRPSFDCSEMQKLITLEVTQACDTLYKIIAPKEAVEDSCTNVDEFTFFYTLNGSAEKKWQEGITETLNIGSEYELLWRVEDKSHNSSLNKCSQIIKVKDKRKFELVCPSDKNIVFNWCEYQYWYNTADPSRFSVRDSLLSDPSHWPSAKANTCVDGAISAEPVVLDSAIYLYDGEKWAAMTNTTRFQYGVQYKIKWVYTKGGGLSQYLSEVKDSCEVNFIIKDNSDPTANCAAMKDYDVFIKSAACDTTFLLSVPEGVFDDNCGIDHYSFRWKFNDGVSSEDIEYSSETANLTFKPGKYTITWWAVDREDQKSAECSQIVMVRDSALFTVICPDTENDKVYDIQTCDAPSGVVLLDSLTKASYKPVAHFDKDCEYAFPSITEAVYAKKSGETTWKLLKDIPSLGLKSEYTIRWIFSVEQSNTIAKMADTCEFNIRIGDVTDPEFTCPTIAEATTPAVATDCNALMSINLSDFNVTDNCETSPAAFKYGYYVEGLSTDTTYVTYSTTPVVVSLPVRAEAYTVVWVVADKAGNRKECEQKVTAKDETKPTITCPNDTTIQLLVSCSDDYHFPKATITDNCTENVDAYWSFDNANFTEYVAGDSKELVAGKYVIYWYGIDEAGKKSETCSANITVKDSIGLIKYCPENGDEDVTIVTCNKLTWNDVKGQFTVKQTPSVSQKNCAEGTNDAIKPSLSYRLKNTGAYQPLSDATEFDYNKTYDIRWMFEKTGDNASLMKDSCFTTLTLKDTVTPTVDCSKLDDITLRPKNSCDTLYTILKPVGVFEDNCGEGNLKYYYKLDANEYVLFNNNKETLTNGDHTLTWKVRDEFQESAECSQTIHVLDSTKINIQCPTEQDVTINTCTAMTWAEVETLFTDNQKATATRTDCKGSEPIHLDSLMYYKKHADADYAKMETTTSFEYNVPYDLKWLFVKEGADIATMKDSCLSTLLLKDTADPKVDCSKMSNITLQPKNGCDTLYAIIQPEGVFTDNCDESALKYYYKLDANDFKLFEDNKENLTNGVHTLIWKVADEFNESATCSQNITVLDSTKINKACPAEPNVTINTCDNMTWSQVLSKMSSEQKATATRTNCSGTEPIELTPNMFYKKKSDKTYAALNLTSPFEYSNTYDIMWLFKKEGTNLATMTDTCFSTVVLQDTANPTVQCGNIKQIVLSPKLTCDTLYLLTKPAGVFDDNCGESNLTYFYQVDGAGSFIEFDGTNKETFSNGAHTLTWKVADKENNESSACVQDVTVKDETSPVITCPADTTIQLLTSCSVDYKFPRANATDNCTATDKMKYYYKFNGDATFTLYEANASRELGINAYTITWYAKDSTGNESATCTANIVVKDSTGFNKVCPTHPAAIIDTCADMTWGRVKANLKADEVAKVSRTNCKENKVEDVNPQMFYKKDGEADTQYAPMSDATVLTYNQLYDIKWLFVKEGENISTMKDSCFSTVMLKDTSVPTVECKKMPEITLHPTTTCDTLYKLVKPAGVFDDKCGESELTYWYKTAAMADYAQFVAGTSAITVKLGDSIVTWKVKDEFNESATCDQKYKATDTVQPKIVCPADTVMNITLACDTTLTLSAPSMSDNCEIDKIFYKFNNGDENEYTEPFDFTFLKGDTLMKWYAKDKSGNVSDTCERHYTVNDVAKPKIDCPSDTAFKVRTKCDTLMKISAPAMSDNCDVVKVSYSFNGQLHDYTAPFDSVFKLGTTTITWYAEDEAGNETTCVRKYNVSDSTGINIVCPAGDFKDVVIDTCENLKWGVISDLYDDAQKAKATRIDCANNVEEPIDPKMYYKESGETTYQELDDETVFIYNHLYDILWEFTKSGENMATMIDSCFSTVMLKDTSVPTVDCDKMSAITLHPTTTCDTLYKLMKPAGVFDDKCGESELTYWYKTEAMADYAQFVAGTSAITVKLGDTTVTWKVKDEFNESATCDQKYTATDTVQPKIVCPADTVMNITLACDTTLTLSAPSMSDNCEIDKIFYKFNNGDENEYTEPFDFTFLKGDTLMKWYAKDKSGNVSDTCERHYTVNDVAKPKIDCPSDTAFKVRTKCDTLMKISAPAMSDNCDVVKVSYSFNGQLHDYTAPFDSVFKLGTTTIVWTAYDEAGNSETCTRDYTVSDSTGINIVCPAADSVVIDTCKNLTWKEISKLYKNNQKATATRIDCANGIEEPIDPKMYYKESDASDYNELTDATEFTYNKLYDILWEFTKSGENMATMIDSCFSTVMLKDTSVPTVDCDKMLPITLHPTTTCDTLYKLMKPAGVFDDKCGESELTYWYKTEAMADYAQFVAGTSAITVKLGDTTVTWKVKDEFNESATCDQKYTATDTVQPKIVCPADTVMNITLTCDTTLTLTAPSMSDNCEIDKVFYKFNNGEENEYTAPFNFTFQKGDTLMKWYAKDKSGNVSDTCERHYTVNDVAKPKIDCPSDTAFKVRTACDTTMKISAPAMSDNCAVVKKFYNFNGDGKVAYTAPFDSTFKLGTTTITWYAEDEAGNETTCVRKYNVSDSTGINIVCPAGDFKDVVIDTCENLKWGVISDLYDDAQKAKATRIDCANNVEEPIDPKMYYKESGETIYQELDDETVFIYNHLYDILWEFTKSGDNMETMVDSCFSTVMLKDTSVPTVDCDKMSAITLHPTTTCDTLYKLVKPAGVFDDKCGESELTYWYKTEAMADYAQFVVGTSAITVKLGDTTVTWKVKDEFNESATCDQKYTATDTVQPKIVCPADTVMNITLACDTTLTLSAPSMSDNCEIDKVFYKFDNGEENEYTAPFNFTFQKGDTLMKWYAKDKSGNVSDTCERHYTVNDVAKPKIDCPSDTAFKVRTACDTTMNITAPAMSDNCAVVKITYAFNGVTHEYTAPFDSVFKLGTTTIVWTAYDEANNSETCTRKYTVSDSTGINIICPAADSVVIDTCENIAWAKILDLYSDDQKATATRIDCANDVEEKIDPVMYFKKEEDTDYSSLTDATIFEYNQVYDILWEFTKSGENMETMIDSCFSKVILRDTSVPTVNCNLMPIVTLEPKESCDTLYTLLEPTGVFDDNCGADALTYYYQYGLAPFTKFEAGVSQITVENGDTTVFWMVKDAIGLASDTCAQKFTVVDVVKPLVVCPNDTTINVLVDCQAAVQLNVATASDFCGVESIQYSVDNATFYKFVGTTLDTTLAVGSHTIYWRSEDVHGLISDVCEMTVEIKDTIVPTVACPTDITIALKKGCDTTLTFTPATAADNCDIKDIYYSFDNVTFAQVTEEPITKNYPVGKDTVYWYSEDIHGNVSDTCKQSIAIQDERKFDLDCPEFIGDGSFIVETCGDLEWKNLKDSLDKLNMSASASYEDCNTSIVTPIDSVVMQYSEKDTDVWTVMEDDTKLFYNKDYVIRWIFTKSGEDLVDVSDTCNLPVILKDTTNPVFDCATINPDSLVQVLDGVCEVPFSEVIFNTYTATDNCDVTIEGILSRTENIADTVKKGDLFEVGKLYELKWIFQDKTGNQITCDQKLMLNSNLKPLFNCDSLNEAVIDTVLSGVCEIDSAGLGIITPFALDACTKDTLWGTGVRKSGLAMNDKYHVGRDTITWTFESIYSTEVAICDQYIFIQSDMKPVFNCDSLNEAVLDTVLSGVCEIDSTGLGVIAPFALDACTKDTIWGTGTRHSGLGMNDKYYVGRDTITWKFVSEYSTDTTFCDQFIFIQSDMKPVFNCDSLNEAVIDTVLQGVCEIDSTGLGVIAPFALDACTKDTIWGTGTRHSGLGMNDKYYVGRDTITWKFVSEYSTEVTYCDQYIFIQSDMKPVFNCDSLNEAVIDTVLSGVCEIDSAGLGIITPFALDACTNDTIWGTGTRHSGLGMNDKYHVGRDTITWKFESEYSTEITYCDQFIFIQSDMKPLFNCDSLNEAVIDTVLQGVCEIDSTGLGVIAPFALDACTNDTIWGIGTRHSGLAMNDKYYVGRDTITWKFESEYSTEITYCDQFIFIQSDMKPVFNCDSLNKAVLDTVLQGVCEIDSTGLGVIAPFALDACTNDTIWGTGTRHSGLGMNDKYYVGRDTITWKFVSEYSTDTTFCDQFIFIQSDMKPLFNCDSLNEAVLDTVLSGVCEIDSAGLGIITPFALDACTNDTIWGTGTRHSGLAMNDKYHVGRDTITWKFESEYSTEITYCDQFIFIQSDMKPVFNCDSLNEAVIDTVLHGVCDIDSAGLNIQTPFALDACTNDTIWGTGVRKSGLAMNDKYSVGRDTITWKFVSEYSTEAAYCEQYIFIQSDKGLEFDCDSLMKHPIERVLDGVCEIDSVALHYDVPFAFDGCLGDTLWGTGVRKSGEEMGGIYKVGRDTIVWTFVGEYSADTITCEQPIFIQSNIKPLFDCDSLNKAVLDTVLHGVCEIDSTGLGVQAPFALDACTNDTIWGTGTRHSGAAMNEAYKVGRDTITWQFVSEYSTDTTYCDQFIFIQSDMQPIFDCDSLNKAVIDTVLSGTCEIDSTGLGIQTPFALDACTKDTVWGVGVRKSGLGMNDKYTVGRDTIVWKFESEYSTEVATCEQFIFIQSDMKPLFDCDSLNKAVLDTVLHGVCEIDSTGLGVQAPFALDACTNDTIWGTGTRASGLTMNDAYKVGRDTITWKFVSEYSTDTTFCDQYIFIQSDLKPLFNCDSLNEAVIDTVLAGVCEIDSAGLGIQTPFALDACTMDTLWGTGVRKSGLAMNDKYTVGRDTIVWKFESEYSTEVATCEQFIFIQSDMKPVFNCDSLNEAILDTVLHGVCEIDSTGLGVQAPFALDACTNDTIWGTGTRASGLAMNDVYKVGRDTITWKFESEYSTEVTYCDQYIFIQSDMQPLFNCDSLKDAVIDTVLSGVCEIDSTGLGIITPFALDACTNDTIWGVGTRTSGAAMNDAYKVGRDTIVWKFESEYATEVATCEQYIFIQSDMKPVFDCDQLTDTTIYLELTQCALDGGQLVLPIPYAVDACTGDSIKGEASREDGKLMSDVFEKGTTTVIWTFVSEYSTTPHTCMQNVTVLDTLPPVPVCADLDTIHANITQFSKYKDVTTYEEAVAAGLVIPTVEDVCDGVITAVGSREDGTPLEGNFPIGDTKIIWTYTDLSGNSAICEQIVSVEDFGVDTLNCPGNLEGMIFACVDDIPAPYATFEEFKAAGGSYTNESKMKPGSFRSTDKMTGDSCVTIVIRTYEVDDLRGDVQSCEEIIYVKDSIAPQFDFILSDTVLSCEDDIFDPIKVTATDNCDPNVKVSVSETNDRSNDPASCDYYNYNIERTYIAMDRCGNSDTMYHHISVRDTVAPTFAYPANWQDTVLASTIKGCQFDVPDFVDAVKSGVSDNCVENAHIDVYQVPAAGTHISTSMRVWIYLVDMCGNKDSLYKFVRVQSPDMIVDLSAFSTDTCVTDLAGVSIASQDFRFAEGYVEIVRANGTIRKVPSVFSYDYYKGDPLPENLLFSDNKYTYSHLFDKYVKEYGPTVAAEKLTTLRQRSESGYYTFVAMDTLSGCADTATAYINVLERPKVKIVSAEMPVCEGNEVSLDPYLQCVDSMGATIIKEGWQLDGKDYDPTDSILGPIAYNSNDKSFAYYAENRCGSTTSYDSHMLLSCYEDSLTAEDTLKYLDNDTTAWLSLRANQLFSRDSILLDVHQRYNPDSILIETDPHDPARIWNGEDITLVLNTPYQYHYLVWRKVVGKYDMENYNSLEGTGFVFDDPDDEEDEVFETSGYADRPYIVDYPSDTTFYYATISDGVCPEASSGLTEVDVLQQIPTAFTPYTKDGLNDIFMERHQVVIFDRYGRKIFYGDNGWNGTLHNGAMADPAVYFYELVMGNGLIVRGTIEIVKLD